VEAETRYKSGEGGGMIIVAYGTVIARRGMGGKHPQLNKGRKLYVTR
jgi:hypothetical protein